MINRIKGKNNNLIEAIKTDKLKKLLTGPMHMFRNIPLIAQDKIVSKILKRHGIEAHSVEDVYNKLYLNVLSGAFNSRYLREKIIKEFDSQEKKNVPASIAYFDGDNLKYINDSYGGHAAGDKEIIFLADIVAAEFGEEIERPLGQDDANKNVKFVHISGDEFLIIAYNMNPQVLINKIKSIKETISQEALRRKKHNLSIKTDSDKLPPPMNFTCSVISKKPGEKFIDINKRADNILNIAKETNRGSIYFEDKCVWGKLLKRDESFGEIKKLIEINRGRNNFLIVCNFNYLEDALDRRNKVNSHTINAVLNIDKLLKEKHANIPEVIRLDDNMSVIILRTINDSEIKNLYDEITNMVKSDRDLFKIINGEIFYKVTFNLGGQAILENQTAETIMTSAQIKLKKAEYAQQDMLIDRRMAKSFED